MSPYLRFRHEFGQNLNWLFLFFLFELKFSEVSEVNVFRVELLDDFINSLFSHANVSLFEEFSFGSVVLVVAVNDMIDELHIEGDISEDNHQGEQVVDF